MARQVSIMFSLKDNFTKILKSMGQEQNKFKKETQQAKAQLDALYAKKRSLKIDNSAAAKAIKQAAKDGQDYAKLIDKKRQLSLDAKGVNKEINSIIRSLGNVEKEVDKVKRKSSSGLFGGMGVHFGSKGISGGFGIGGAIGAMLPIGAAAGAGAGMFKALQMAGEMEQSSMAFTTMLGDKGRADTFLEGLKKFAIDTPFEFKQLLDSSKKMLAYGFGENQIIPTLTAVGNASAGLGLGAEGVDRLTIALGQMRAKSKVSADEMRQLTEAGVPAWEILAQATHLTTAEVMKLSEQGVIPADKAISALLKGMNQRFPNMMDDLSKTLFGLTSSLKDFANLRVISAFGEGLKQGIVPTLTQWVDKLTKSDDKLKMVQDRLTGIGKYIGEFVAGKAEGIVKYFDTLFSDEKFQQAGFGGKVKEGEKIEVLPR